ncbi:MAG: twitching motility protein PilT [Lachnospiraceae bacterium]|nr:twitching motility protein PilT [Lachnospiraceae bacterium]MBR6271661.1 twitching motility protein PilT [Lachnospiraceae bacterium]
MVQIIAGEKGKGKTKLLLDTANESVKTAHGSIVYIDKSTKHMYELNRNIRLINLFEYPVHSYEAFMGFIGGIISQDHDLEIVYLDSFLKLSHLSAEEISQAVLDLGKLGEKFGLRFVLSVSEDISNIPEDVHEYIVHSL